VQQGTTDLLVCQVIRNQNVTKLFYEF